MNFLSVTFDDMNAFAFLKSLYGGTLHTPNIDRVMAMGTTFENAYAQVAVCNASRASALSGLNPGLTGVHNNSELWYEYLDPAATLPARLKSAGYYTGVIGKVFHDHFTPEEVSATVSDYRYRSPPGLFERAGLLNPHPSSQPIGVDGDYLATSHAIGLLNAAGSDPFALFLGIVKPHLGWVVPQEYFDLYPLEEIELPFTLDGDLSDVPAFMKALVHGEEHQGVVDANAWKLALQGYFASISFADAMLGRVLETLEANGQLGDTAILLWTDHGYHLGDKDNWHKFTLWEEAARAPFVLALPGGEDDGQRVGQVVELVDLMPTVLDMLGLDVPGGLSGRSLRPFIEDPARIDGGVAVTTMYGSAAIRTNDYRYIRYEDGSTELYDLRNDPNQWHNLAADPRYRTARTKLDAELRLELAADGWMWVEADQWLWGTAADEQFVIASGFSRVQGGEGDDTYFINDGETFLVEDENQGKDTVYTSSDFTLPDHFEDLHLKIRSLNRTLVGNDLANFISGNGRLQGLDGNDRLWLTGRGISDGGAGDDRLIGSGVRDQLFGGDGNDELIGSTGIDVLDGGAGNADLDGESDVDTVSYASAGAGVTVSLLAPKAQDTGGAGTDTLAGLENITGSGFGDALTGDGGVNVILGGAGDDVIEGGGGNDTLDGGDGVDTASFASAAEGVSVNLAFATAQQTHGAGEDKLLRVENLVGSGGDDHFAGSGVANRIEGGGGEDRIRGQSGADALHGGGEKDVLYGGYGDDAANGDAGDDLVFGELGNDSLEGGAGSDRLLGEEGADTVAGGEGADTLRGGVQRDTATGGAGADQFAFENGDVMGFIAGCDRITDFSRADGDKINVRGLDARTATPDLDDRFSFIGTGAFSGNGVGGELRFRVAQGNTYIEGDVDGDGTADFYIRIDGIHTLVAGDFVL